MSKVFISTSCVAKDHIIDSVNTLSKITQYIELSGGSKHQSDSLGLLKAAQVKSELTFLLHSYFPPPKSDFVLNFADSSAETRDFICSSMKYVKGLRVPYFSVHAGYKHTFIFENELLIKGKDHFLSGDIANNIRWFRQAFPDIPLALENLYPNDRNLDSCFATSVAEIEQILNYDVGVLLLLDLGHLKISANLLGFDFNDAVDYLFSRYSQRIVELHLSENESVYDDHDIISKHSGQYSILKKHRETIIGNNINLTIEARGKDLVILQESYNLVRSIFEEE
ncbi:hypothetical protein HGB07_04130 [Candidatus Roizmanbacteria bacterium]|nr:hypothetical protein [Candidatus Roizmanbacteria bacterium]